MTTTAQDLFTFFKIGNLEDIGLVSSPLLIEILREERKRMNNPDAKRKKPPVTEAPSTEYSGPSYKELCEAYQNSLIDGAAAKAAAKVAVKAAAKVAYDRLIDTYMEDLAWEKEMAAEEAKRRSEASEPVYPPRTSADEHFERNYAKWLDQKSIPHEPRPRRFPEFPVSVRYVEPKPRKAAA